MSSNTDRGQAGAGTAPTSTVCPICGGQGFVVLDLPVNHPDFGHAVRCQCRASDQALRRQSELARVSNLAHLKSMTFATFYPNRNDVAESDRALLRSTFDISRRFAARPEGWLLLTGPYGSGKTHLAAAIAHEVVGRGDSAIFVVVPDLLDHLRSAFGPNAESDFDERFETVRQTPLLVLDDLGAQSATPWAKEKLFQLLNHRYVAKLPTVITTNLRLAEFEARLRSRLADPEVVTPVHIDVPDYRTSANPESHETSTLTLHVDKTFETFNPARAGLTPKEAENLTQVKVLAETFAASPRGWLVFSGSHYCGKTHLAAAIANRRLQQHHEQPVFVVVPDLLDYLRSAFNPNTVAPLDIRFDEIRRSPLLVLDDLGTESATPWAREKLFQLLNFRHAARLPTVITTSVEVDSLDEWLATRLRDPNRCTVAIILAPSYYGKAQQAQKRVGRGR
jgi:DNA replication protein DnaC